MKPKPLISVVISTKNEEANIASCLESIKAQTYSPKNIETIVVDNNSTDKTKEISRQYTKNIFNFGPERSAQRNFGMIKKASGKYVMYLDADMILSPTVIEKSVEKLEKEDVVALYVPEVVLGNSYWSKVRRFERSFYDGTVIDCARIIRIDIFKMVGGFDEMLTGPEDWDLDKKIKQKGKIELLSSYKFKESIDKPSQPIIFHNEAKFDLKKYLNKKKYYSVSFSKYIEKWGKNDEDIKKQFGFWYRYFGIFVEEGKWNKILKYPFVFLGIFVLRFLVGASFAFGGLGRKENVSIC